MRVAVVHHTLQSLGGGERVCVALIEALNEVGIVPDVYCTNPVDLSFIRSFFGKDIRASVRALLPFAVRAFGIYTRALSSFLSVRLREYDRVVNTTGTYTPLLLRNLVRDYTLYVYSPIVEEVSKYAESAFWRAYYQPYKWLVSRSIRKLGGVRLVSVSEFTRQRVRRLWGYDSVVVYPPVDLEKFSEAWDGPHSDGVISIARFSPEKNHLWQLVMAKVLPEVTFRICGSARAPMYRRWLSFLKAKAEEMELRNVEFHANVPLEKLIELVAESKLFVHTMIKEDFGLASCEAVAGGLVPVVHDSGGQREVVPLVELRFRTVAAATRIIARLHSAPRSELDEYRLKLREHVQQFDEANFKRRMLEVLRLC